MTTTSAAIEMAGLDAVAQAELVRRGEVTAAELVGWAIERIEDLNPILNALVTPMCDQALAAAAAMTPPTGRLAGFLTWSRTLSRRWRVSRSAKVPTSCVATSLTSTPSSSSACGAQDWVIVGKTNTPEFGMAPTCEPVLHGPTRNPWDTTRLTSGSSGGAASAVAARMVPMAHGNDLGACPGPSRLNRWRRLIWDGSVRAARPLRGCGRSPASKSESSRRGADHAASTGAISSRDLDDAMTIDIPPELPAGEYATRLV